jgi:hypothetical protein
MSEEKNKPEEFINPIDKDKVAENPGLLPYAHHSSSAIIKPEDKGKIKGRALMAMAEQTNMQMDQIKAQIELLAQQAKKLQVRREISEQIYKSEFNFDPIIHKIYHFYHRKNGKGVLSMVSPEEWGPTIPYERHLATARLLADHTWEVLEDFLQDDEEL